MEPVVSPLNQGTFNGPGMPGMAPGQSNHYPVYDRLLLDSALPANPDRVLFQTAVQQSRDGRTLTFADTNNQYGNRVPDKQKYTYYWLAVHFMLNPAVVDEDGVEAFFDLIRETYIYYKIDPLDPIFIVPLWKFFGAAQFGVQSLTAPMQWPNPQWSGQWKFERAIVLEQGTIAGLHIVLPGGTSPAILDDSFIGFVFDAKRDAIT